MNNITRMTLAALAAAAMLAACDRPGEERTTGQKVDSAVNKVEEKAQDAKEAAARAADAVGDKAKDMRITTAINAELAKDPKLSATRINVDTVDGRVTLKGTAPDATSRDRATTLASAVEGVKSVDNQLAVKGT
jgi:hyperosmotically inducible periplasmic protein